MLALNRIRQVYVARHRLDFRRSYDGILAECYQLGLDPFAGDVVIFVSRCRRRIKVMFADQTGLWVAAKRFTEQTIKSHFRFVADPSVDCISAAELMLFFEGSAYTIDARLKSVH